jgi:PAS domain S-box-containing protein
MAVQRREFLDLLIEAGQMLSTSRDYRTGLQQVAHLIVPALADWCVVDIVDGDGGRLQHVAVAHADAAQEQVVRALLDRYPARLKHPVFQVVETGQPVLIPHVTDSLSAAFAQDEEYLPLVRAVAPRSVMIVPLLARDRTLGALSLVNSESERTFTQGDVPLALELAGRAAAAIDQSQLLHQTQTARSEAEATQEFLQRVLHTVGALVVVLDGEGRIVQFNRCCEETTGYRSEEVLGERVWDLLVPPEDRPGVRMVFAQLRAGQFPTEHENAWLTRSGERRQIAWTNTAVIDQQRAVRFVVGTGIDVTEQRLAEQARERSFEELLAERARLEAVLEHLPVGVIIAEAASGRLVLGNARVEQIWRHPLLASASVGEYDRYQGFHADGRPYRAEEWPLARSILSGEAVQSEEIGFLRGDGTRGVMSVSASPIRGSGGDITAGVAVFDDITARKQAEAERLELQARERSARAQAAAEVRFRALLEAAPDAIIVTNGKGRIVLVNARAETLFGYTREELLGQMFKMVVPEGLRRTHASHRVRYARAPSVRSVGAVLALLARRKDGSEFPVEIGLSPTETEEGAGMIAVIRNVTERTQMEATLLESEYTIRALYTITAAPDRAADDRIQELLALGCARFGLPIGILAHIEGERYEVAAVHAPAEIGIGRGDVYALGQTYCRETLRSPVPVGFEHAATSEWCSHPCYAAFRLEAYLAVPVRVGERVYGTLNFSSPAPRATPFTPADHDVLRLMAQWIGGELARQEVEAERVRLLTREVELRMEADRLKDEFLAGISHDLRTPVAAIKSSVGVVLANVPPDIPEPLHRLLVNIDLSADRMDRLVADLVDLARLQAGRMPLKLERVDLREVIGQAIRESDPLLQTRGQRLSTQVPPEPAWAMADTSQLERVLLNLLSNAVKYGRQHGRIDVQVTSGDGQVVVTVTDDGPGIPAADCERIFDRFYRLPGDQQRQPGSGLGLTIARTIAELHGGRVWVESTSGKGATFFVALPLASNT